MFVPRPIKVLAVSAALCLQVGCQNHLDRETSDARHIIDQLRLPTGARPIAAYSRYFVNVGGERVEGVLIIEPEDWPSDVKEACSEAGAPKYPCQQSDLGIAHPNTTKWLDNADYLPVQAGGGCSYVRLTYDKISQRLLQVECNGDN